MECKAAGRVDLMVSWQNVGWRVCGWEGDDVLAHGDAVKTFENLKYLSYFLFILL